MNRDQLNLLIVDDDRDLLRQLEFLLEDDFRKIFTASSKEEALELSKKDIGVFLIDVRLSETDEENTGGLELAKEIRKKNGKASIVMMSRYDARKYETLSREQAHADAFIRKPFTMDEFIDLVRQKFCGGAGGGFSKEPPARRRQIKNADTTAY